MATTIVDYMVGSCIKKLQDIITDEAILILGVKQELNELHRTVKQIRCFLTDAEQRRTEELAVNNWLGELKGAMYDVDDIIDLASFEGSKLLPPGPSSRNSTRCTAFSIFSCIPDIWKRHEIAIRIRDFNDELKKISERGERFLKLRNMLSIVPISIVKQKKTCHLVEPNLVGKEILHACKNLVELVFANTNEKAYKIGIVGTGGVGKTTLAQKIYNDHKIKGAFSKRAWICVSQEYTEIDLLKEILRNFGVHKEQGETMAELQSKLAIAAKETSFFLVIDDVWKPEVWTDLLRTPLHSAAMGIVIVTTRHDNVAKAIGVEHMHRVELMSTNVGWELLWRSMHITEEKEVENLRDIGMEIVCKCGGLPLAVKLIARVLATKEKNEDQWRMFVNRSAWSMRNLPVELRGALYLSYDELPQYLKPCFLYCALYPEDMVIYRDDLVRFWIAEGFIEEQDHQLLEETAEEYYYELIDRNLLQSEPPSRGQGLCKMHDLLRLLAWHIAKEECFLGHPHSLVAKTPIKLRRCGINTKEDMVMLHSIGKEQIVTMRTLIFFRYKSLEEEKSFLVTLPNLRILDLTGVFVKTIPNCIGGMIHLRLLDLNYTCISSLPECIGSLKNLETLNLAHCLDLHTLPLATTQLSNLRRLSLDDTPINQVPKGIQKLKFLNDLRGFPIGGGSVSTNIQDGWNLEELVDLQQLRRLDMIKLERCTPCTGTDSFVLTNKRHLKVVKLWCTEPTDEAYSEEDASKIEKIFEQIKPPCNLEELDIRSFFGRRFPTWFGTTDLYSMKLLSLEDCKSCIHLPPVGQLPNLKHLRIKGGTGITKIGREFVGWGEGNPLSIMHQVAFPKLEWLMIKDMPNLENWSFVDEEMEEEEADATTKEGEEDGAADVKQKGEAPSPRSSWLLPCLKKLQVVDCPKLRALPRHLGQQATSLKELIIRRASCFKAVDDLPFLSGGLSIGGCEDLVRVSNLPQVRELYVSGCPNLWCVEELGSLEQLWLDKDMQVISLLWVPGLQEQCCQRHGDELEINDWPHRTN